VVPTYNEMQNLDELVRRIQQACSTAGLDAEIVIVDDNSPDGTGARAEELTKTQNLKVVHRSGKLGLSSAVLEGFKVASGSVLVVMDADLSHPPEKIPEMVSKIDSGEAEIVVGSRYVKGGSVENWPFTRRIISKGATLLARWLTKVKDPMSGFFALKRSVIEGVSLDPVGYKIGLEILVKGKYSNTTEVPIHFADRKAGKSKLGGGEYLRYIDHVFMLYEYRKPWLSKYIKFSTIGGIGAVINTAILWTASVFFLAPYQPAAVLAFSVAATSNYFMNRKWTYRSKRNLPRQYSQFLAVSAFGLVLNLVILTGIIDGIMPAFDIGRDKARIYLVVANLVAIFVVSIFNFFANSFWTFRHETRRR
jgi:dolichol-phosphate mannosyltransferase